jgi:Mg-chelatase subunit ChlD
LLSAATRGADDTVAVTFVETFQRDEASLPVSAVGLRPTSAATTSAPTDLVVLIDTSASQTGDHRVNAARAAVALLDKAREDNLGQLKFYVLRGRETLFGHLTSDTIRR